MSSRRGSDAHAKDSKGSGRTGAKGKSKARDSGSKAPNQSTKAEAKADGRKPKAGSSKADAREPKSQGRAGKGRGGKGQARGSKGAGGRRPRSGPGRGGAREFSAGGVVVRGGDVAVIVPTRRAADGSRVLSLPKGHVDPGETPLQAAEREVREETGVEAEPVRELGESRYWYRREGRTIGKSVHFYLFRYLRGDTADHDEEVEEARWIPLRDAEKRLTYPAEREMVARAMEYLKEGERKDR